MLIIFFLISILQSVSYQVIASVSDCCRANIKLKMYFWEYYNFTIYILRRITRNQSQWLENGACCLTLMNPKWISLARMFSSTVQDKFLLVTILYLICFWVCLTTINLAIFTTDRKMKSEQNVILVHFSQV